jgi:hypothetical protein
VPTAKAPNLSAKVKPSSTQASLSYLEINWDLIYLAQFSQFLYLKPSETAGENGITGGEWNKFVEEEAFIPWQDGSLFSEHEKRTLRSLCNRLITQILTARVCATGFSVRAGTSICQGTSVVPTHSTTHSTLFEHFLGPDHLVCLAGSDFETGLA